jgi:uncharacterized membrane protein
MPFCTNCGKQIGTADVFCATCGTRQAGNFAPPLADPVAADILGGISPRTVSILCYIPVVGWIACIIALASPRFRSDRDVRFHAFQGLYLFVAWLLVDWVIHPFLEMIPGPGSKMMRLSASLIYLSVYLAWIWMLIKTSQGLLYRLPIIGEMAERSVAEQR